MSESIERFAENGIDFSILRHLTDQDLKDIGVLLGHRRKILAAITELAGAVPVPPQGNSHPPRKPEDSAERRQITVMFCDLVGSTALSARLDPEDLRGIIGAYHRCCTEMVERNGGFVAKYMGDGVLAYFGYPQAHEHDAERAVGAGLTLVDAVPKLVTNAGSPLQVRVGLATGLVVVGDLIGAGAAQEQAVVGETPNLAARLQALAESGAVVIASSTRRLTGGLFEYRDLGTVALKGFAEDVRAWQVLGAGAAESRFEALRSVTTQLVGRDEEIEILMRRWGRAKQGDGQVVLISGEPGIGKSRISQAILARVSGEPHIRLRYFCSPHYRNSVLYPFITQLERAAGFRREDTAEQRLVKLEAVLGQGTNDLREVVPLLAELLSIPTDSHYSPLNLIPQMRKEKTLQALLKQLDGLSALQPVLLLVEDVHWCDPTSLEMLGLMVDHVPPLRVLLIITARPEFVRPWPDHAYVTNIALTRFSRTEGATLIELVTGGKALPDEVKNQILDRTDGVPLFLEELTKTVLESGLLQDHGDRFVLERPLPRLAIPTSLHGSLMARLDRLAPVREVAQSGSIIGREFSYELLSEITDLPKEKLDDALAELCRAELMFCRGKTPAATYVFKHALVRDAAYAGLLKSRRVQLHAAVATAFEQRFTDILETEPETIAHHLTEAGLFEKAVSYWLRAGKNAAMRFANIEAIAHLRRGIEVVDRLSDGPERDRIDLDLQLALGPCLIATQPTSSAAVSTFARARKLCERLGDPPEYLLVMHWLMVALAVRGELLQAREASETLLNLAEARGDTSASLNALRAVGLMNLLTGRIVIARSKTERTAREFALSNEAERAAARAAGQDAGAAGLAVMSWALWLLGYSDDAVNKMTAALRRAEEVKHPHTLAYAFYYASVLHALRGEHLTAQRYAKRCFQTSEEHGFRQWQGPSGTIHAICTNMLDPSSDSINQVLRRWREYRGTGYQFGMTAVSVLLCKVLLTRSRFDTVVDVVEHGLSVCNVNSERFFEAELYRLKAVATHLSRKAGSNSEAPPLLDMALQVARSQKARSLEIRCARDLADIWREQGKYGEARNLLGPIYGWFTEGFDTLDLKEAKALLGQLA